VIYRQTQKSKQPEVITFIELDEKKLFFITDSINIKQKSLFFFLFQFFFVSRPRITCVADTREKD
jgi:hypothetical protein